jgi:MFS family permease
MLPETRPEPDPSDAPAGYGAALRDPLLLGLTGLQLCFGYMLLQSAATLPLAMEADGHGAAAYGLIMALAGLVVVVLQPPAAGPLGRRPHGVVYTAGLLVVAAGFTATLLADGMGAFASTVVIWAAGEVAVASVAGAIVADLAPVHLRGRYHGVFSMAMPVAAMLAPGLGTAIFQAAGETAHWLSVGAVGVAAAVAATALLSRGSRQPA